MFKKFDYFKKFNKFNGSGSISRRYGFILSSDNKILISSDNKIISGVRADSTIVTYNGQFVTDNGEYVRYT
jgi:hypothetical protein